MSGRSSIAEGSSGQNVEYTVKYTCTGVIKSADIEAGAYTAKLEYNFASSSNGNSYFTAKPDGSLNYKASFEISTLRYISTPGTEADWWPDFYGRKPTDRSVKITKETGMYDNIKYQSAYIQMFGTLFIPYEVVERTGVEFAPYVVYSINFTAYANQELYGRTSVNFNVVDSKYLNFFTP
jgi:hypothetical protein